MQGARNAFVVTAAHCLPFFPPCISASHTEERTYKGLLGQLGEEPTVWAECLFVDPISDLAVLGPPDGQALSDETTAYEALNRGFCPTFYFPPFGRHTRMVAVARWAMVRVPRALVRRAALDNKRG
jgi:hypothetical protein